MTGKVCLVGAGPGDAGLLTLKGERALRSAQVVVYDRLVGDGVLAMMPESAEKINVGKNSGSHPVPQERINEILLEKALEGKYVVRLKGGDCFLFGRGGEELEKLCENGVPFEVVPGVPSPVAATAYAGIPLTHRDFCASVHFITGHRRENGSLNLDYEALVRLRGTLVFMMSVATCGEIARGLAAAGMPEDTDCAIIENGTRPCQRKFVTTLSGLEETAEKNKVISPSLIVVGEVCSLSDKFDWFTKAPLFGRRILVTAPEASAARLMEKLSALGADAAAAPAIKTVPLEFAVPELAGRAVVFTSAFGVKTCLEKLFSAGRDARAFGGARIAAIGAGTAAALRGYGLAADLVPEKYDAETLAKEMLEKGLVRPGDTAVLLRARAGTPSLPEKLREAGIVCEDVPVYDTIPVPYEGGSPDSYDFVTFTSESAVLSFRRSCELAGYGGLGRVRALCIGPQTAKAARDAGMDAVMSKEATLDSMAEYLKEEYKK